MTTAIPIGLGYIHCRGSEVTVGSEDPLQFFLKSIFVQEGSSGTRFDHGQFYLPPHCACILSLCYMGAVACALSGGHIS